MKGKMAIIGDGDSVLIFKAVGVNAFSVNENSDVKSLIKDLSKEYQIIFITDNIAQKNKEIINEYLASTYPIIIPVPSKEGSNGFGMEELKYSMEKALGIDIFQNEEN
ncbi:MAG: V-type ATP synthase subunit F [Clostridia bacterium]|nr:V-type ATP synthase subunit F [Clostridia bacterium]